jgi:hypothetical protein
MTHYPLTWADAWTGYAIWFILAAGYMWITSRPGALPNGRERSPLEHSIAKALGKPLTVGRLVQIDAGVHRGLAGYVHDLFVEAATGMNLVTVRFQDDTYVTVRRDEVSPLLG